MDIKDKNINNHIKRSLNKTISTDINQEQKKKKRKKRNMLILLAILLLILGSLGFLAYKGYIFSKGLGFQFDPSSLISSEKPELQKDSSGNYTNVMLVGIDTRESGGLLNTDTVILVSYNYETHKIAMISIPRDFHVEVAEDVNWYVRINSIYSSAEQEEEGTGLEALKETVERVTGQEIQYYAMINFNAFVEIIDAVGGIDVDVENSFTDYMYPDGLDYKTVSFEEGLQTMDGETALEYSRSRHSQQNNEGTDYARARRQQKVIIALKDKILSTESLSSPKTLMSIFSSIAENIQTSGFTISDIEAGVDLAEEFEENNGEAFSFVLDPTSGGYSLVERKNLESGAYAIGPKLGFGEYDDIMEYIELIKTNPGIYAENASIMIYDTGIGFQAAKEKTEELQESLPYLDIAFAGTIFSNKEGFVVYTSTDKPNTLETLSNLLNTELNEQPEYITSNLNGEDVTILLGETVELEEN